MMKQPARPASCLACQTISPGSQDIALSRRITHHTCIAGDQRMHESLSLNGAWQLYPTPLSLEGEAGCRKVAARATGWLAAEVPGEVHLDLMRAGKMDDPEIGDNARRCRWPSG
jgi:hypothetical protein